MKQKTLGIIGGVSWHSTLEYYRLLNFGVQNKLGGAHSAKLILFNLDMQEIKTYQTSKKFDKVLEILVNARQSLERSGAEHFIVGANTLHKHKTELMLDSKIPMVCIMKATAQEILAKGFKSTLLLGTKITMSETFYIQSLASDGVQAVVPSESDQNTIQSIIFDEIIPGKLHPSQSTRLVEIIKKHKTDCVIMGCTEIPLVLNRTHTEVPLIDTIKVHVDAALTAMFN